MDSLTRQKYAVAPRAPVRRLTRLPIVRLLAIAGVFHVCLSISLFIVGRAQLAPSIVDRDGIIGSFAFDSYQYQTGATQLAEALRHGAFTTWLKSPEPVHVKIISVPFSVLSPLFGYSTLSAEPFNLICYLMVLSIVFLLGKELSGERTGLVAAAIVALLPTFVLHNLQLLKDPLFIAASIAIVLFVMTWLTRTFTRRSAIVIGTLTAATILVVLRVRFTVGILIVAVVTVGFVLLLLRQIIERRWRPTNMLAACPAIMVAAIVIGLNAPTNLKRVKQIPSNQVGVLKEDVGTGFRMPTQVVHRVHAASQFGESNKASFFVRRLNELAYRVGTIRSRFTAAYPGAGSLIDATTDFQDFPELVGYLPRAFEIGLWAPFPNTWFSTGQRVGAPGRLLSGGETLFIYFFQVLAVIAIIRDPRELPLWFLTIIVALGVTALPYVIPNIGALYRFRYAFWIFVIVMGVRALQSFMNDRHATGIKQLRNRKLTFGRSFSNQFILKVAYATLLTLPFMAQTSCASHSVYTAQSPPVSTAVGSRSGASTIALVNLTGTGLTGVYLSPSKSAGWEENILQSTQLSDGARVDISFADEALNSFWDLRVEGGPYYSEWRNIDLHDASRIVLVLKAAPGPVVIANIDERGPD